MLKQHQVDGADDDDSSQQTTIANLTLPLLLLGFCSVITTVLQIKHQVGGRHRRCTILLSRDNDLGFQIRGKEVQRKEEVGEY